MKVLVYEWVSGGGLLGLEGAAPASLLREGVAMARAVGEDFAGLPGAEVTLLRDLRVTGLSARGCRVTPVDSAAERDEVLGEHFRGADAVLLIAPETDRRLLRLVKDAEAAGARLISPASRFVAVAGDKGATAEALIAAGVAAPRGVTLEEDEPPPAGFPRPAVLKPLDGAGSEDTYLLHTGDDHPPAYPWPRRLEPFMPGLAASVGVLCSPAGATALLPCRQHLSRDGRLRYLGGAGPLAPGLAQRARDLALAAVAALPPTIGYVGVDLVLGADPSGAEDCVIEVNPRLTTSYAAVRFAARTSLAAAMLDCAAGRAPDVAFDPRPFRFDTDGIVSYEEP